MFLYTNDIFKSFSDNVLDTHQPTFYIHSNASNVAVRALYLTSQCSEEAKLRLASLSRRILRSVKAALNASLLDATWMSVRKAKDQYANTVNVKWKCWKILSFKASHSRKRPSNGERDSKKQENNLCIVEMWRFLFRKSISPNFKDFINSFKVSKHFSYQTIFSIVLTWTNLLYQNGECTIWPPFTDAWSF